VEIVGRGSAVTVSSRLQPRRGPRRPRIDPWWDPNAARAPIDPECTLAAIRGRPAIRIAEAAQAGARIAVATARPASLLGLA
jgi:hypothetical protein